eukprot:1150991-Pelagomonas_calceolata.AAC.5
MANDVSAGLPRAYLSSKHGAGQRDGWKCVFGRSPNPLTSTSSLYNKAAPFRAQGTPTLTPWHAEKRKCASVGMGTSHAGTATKAS